MVNKIIVYGTPTCPWCIVAKKFFIDKEIKFVYKDVSEDMEAAREMFAKSKQMGVPVIDVNGEIMVGFDKGKIDKLLSK